MSRRANGTLAIAVLIALCAIAGLLVVLVSSLTGSSLDPSAPTAVRDVSASPEPPDRDALRPATLARDVESRDDMDLVPADVVAKVAGGVVTVVYQERDGGDGAWVTVSTSTGFVIDDEGHIVTNARAIAEDGRILALFPDGDGREATVTGVDPLSEIAVIQVQGRMPVVLRFGNSSRLRAGQSVLAIGSPLGSFTNSVTQGVVSALGRSLDGEEGQPDVGGLIQHDAAINEGNAGGPLFDLSGNVIGVNTAGVQSTPGGEPAQGLFFALPSNLVERVVASLIDHGVARYPYLGIESVTLTPALIADGDLPVTSGVLVIRTLPGGPAEDAGVRAGDILLALGTVRIDPGVTFTDALFQFAPGETVSVEVRRGDETFVVDIALTERPADL